MKSKIVEEWMELRTKHAHLMQVAFVILSHARICETDSCQMGKRCTKMKSVLHHASKCPKQAECTTKKFLFSLCQSHNEICSDHDCPVDFCRDKWNRHYDVRGTKQDRNICNEDVMTTSSKLAHDSVFGIANSQEEHSLRSEIGKPMVRFFCIFDP